MAAAFYVGVQSKSRTLLVPACSIGSSGIVTVFLEQLRQSLERIGPLEWSYGLKGLLISALVFKATIPLNYPFETGEAKHYLPYLAAFPLMLATCLAGCILIPTQTDCALGCLLDSFLV